MFEICKNCSNIDWNETALLYKRAPLGEREPSQLQRAFNNSYAVVFVFDKTVLIGAGRAISDGEYYAGIFDVVVLPEYQQQGVGRLIMDSLMQTLDNQFVILTTTIGKENFYKKWCFKKHKTAMAIYPPDKQKNAELYLEN